MAIFRLTKKFHFEMAHVLNFHEGACSNLHGHSYTLLVSVKGNVENKNLLPTTGMVMDFGMLKKIVNDEIISYFDHALVVHESMKSVLPTHAIFSKTVFVDYQPTSENILQDMALKIQQKLPENVELHHLILQETPDSFAEWWLNDNC
ncbi:MAG: 6-carboxytetrahydropterin synthase [Bacteroidales bacterium]|nr:6-carboxytetrahydropterin synthase [Bacteroidales bacterium]